MEPGQDPQAGLFGSGEALDVRPEEVTHESLRNQLGQLS